MKNVILALVLSFSAQLAWAFTMATGPTEGTYFQIGQDIKNLAAKDGVELQVAPTKGSIENIQLLGTGKVDLAIVQLDALRFASDVLKEHKGLELFDRVKVVLNLYPEEIHVFTNKKDIQTFYHLEGKRVSIGTEGGGSALSSAVLFSVYDINATISFDSFEDGVKKVIDGALDAVIFVGGAPVPFIDKLAGKMHLVRLPANPALEQIYLRSRLTKAQYNWMAADTETYAVPASILGVDRRDENYSGQMQQLVLSVLNGRDYLEKNGHAKWKSSILQTYFPTRGYEPTNQLIQIFNVLDKQGYKIVKK
jgi:TRAP transporter TAXI family solute receptor